jgi:hypothetical protein
MVTRVISILIIALMFSCSATKKAKRKYRKADKLMREAGILAPQLSDTIFIVKMDTVILNKDSIQVRTRLLLDTVKVDRIIEKLILVREEGGDTRALKKEIYEELLPDLHYSNIDSLKITIDNKDHFVRFKMDVSIEDDILVVTARPTDNVPFVSVKQEINIDAKKMGRFWRGFGFGSLFIIIVFVVLWFLRGTIGAYIKTIAP